MTGNIRMDKTWIDSHNRVSRAYFDGVDSFLQFAFRNVVGDTRIYCPCKKCYNRYLLSRDIVREHLIVHGFLTNYKKWRFHGEVDQPIESNQHLKSHHDSVTVDDMTAAKRNKANRAHQFAPYRTGQTSFAKTKDVMMKKGEKTDRISVFIKTRTGSNEEVGDTESAEIISPFNESLSQIPVEEQTEEVKEKISSKVIGPDHCGYARTQGHGPSPTNVGPSSSQQTTIGQMQQDLKNLQVANQDLQAKYDMLYSFLQRQFPEFEEHMMPSNRKQVPNALSAHQDLLQVNTEATNDKET